MKFLMKFFFSLQKRSSLWAAYAVIAKYVHFIEFTSDLVMEDEGAKKGCKSVNGVYSENCSFKCESYNDEGCRESLTDNLQDVLCDLKNIANDTTIPNRTMKHINLATRCVRAHILNTTKGHRECLRLSQKGLPLLKEKYFRKKRNNFNHLKIDIYVEKDF